MSMKLFGLWRGGERKADVVVLSSGKCVVAWPTSVIVYDSEDAARAVHITHMGGRGEPTEFRDETNFDQNDRFMLNNPKCIIARSWNVVYFRSPEGPKGKEWIEKLIVEIVKGPPPEEKP